MVSRTTTATTHSRLDRLDVPVDGQGITTGSASGAVDGR
jgi:hypothetical protein